MAASDVPAIVVSGPPAELVLRSGARRTETRFTWANGQLAFSKTGGFGPRQGEKLDEGMWSLTNEEWDRVWRKADEIGMWRWDPFYGDRGTRDGADWSVHVVHGSHVLDARGNNKFPPRFEELLAALLATRKAESDSPR